MDSPIKGTKEKAMSSSASTGLTKLAVLELKPASPRHQEPPAAAATSSGGNLIPSVLGIIKGMVGPAILYLPHGFAGAGYATALPIMAISTILFLHSSQCLLDAWRYELEQLDDDDDDDKLVVEEEDGDDDLHALLEEEEEPLEGRDNIKLKQVKSLSYPDLAYRVSFFFQIFNYRNNSSLSIRFTHQIYLIFLFLLCRPLALQESGVPMLPLLACKWEFA
jgi:hypothetical protein